MTIVQPTDKRPHDILTFVFNPREESVTVDSLSLARIDHDSKHRNLRMSNECLNKDVA